MEIIQLSGYSVEEKMAIARLHLVQKQREAHGLKPKDVKISDKTLQAIIEQYTRESGVRELDRMVASVMRNVAKTVVNGDTYDTNIKPEQLHEILGPHRYQRDKYEKQQPCGVAVGLAWTQVGGDILYIESVLSKGKGGLTLTGNLGDVMKESATTALAFVKANADTIGIDPRTFDQYNLHIHVPEGATPKDGPSAGITMMTTLVSSLTQRRVRNNLAMTGEISLRGKVTPVGGIKEKILAAKRSGLKEIILCYQNEKDVIEIGDEYTKGLTFHYVENMLDVLDLALEKKQTFDYKIELNPAK
jgi:ATP-dependent Lon protease